VRTARTITTEPKKPARRAWLASALMPRFSMVWRTGVLMYQAISPNMNPRIQNAMRTTFLPNFPSTDDSAAYLVNQDVIETLHTEVESSRRLTASARLIKGCQVLAGYGQGKDQEVREA